MSKPESYTDYLRRVGKDYQASYTPADEESPTAADYYEAAEKLDELLAFVRGVVEFDHYFTDDDTHKEVLARIEARAKELYLKHTNPEER